MDLSERLARLSPQQRESLLQRLADSRIRPQVPRMLPRSSHGAQDLPLSFPQQRLWFLHQLEPASSAYNTTAALLLRGVLRVESLAWSLGEVVRRHEILRTVFVPSQDGPAQVVLSELGLELPVVDLEALPEAARECEARHWLHEEAEGPFDLTRAPLWRAGLLRLGPDEHLFHLTLHHIVCDGWSSGVLIREVEALYRSRMDGVAPMLPDLPIQYADFALWQREWLQGPVLEAQLEYWRKQLRRAEPGLPLPYDHLRPAGGDSRGSSRPVNVPHELLQVLRRIAQKEGTTLFTILLAAFKALLFRYTGQEDLSIGIPIANRKWPEIENLIGFFVNTLVIRTVLSPDLGFDEALRRVLETSLQAHAHQDLPFEKLVEELAPAREAGRMPLFEVMFSFQNAPRPALRLADLVVELLEVGNRQAKFDLMLDFWDAPEGFSGRCEYRADLFEASTIARFVSHFETLVAGIAAEPRQRLSNLPLLAAAEVHQILREWNSARGSAEPPLRVMSELFEEQVERHASREAVSFAGERISYRELDRRANRLAHYLRSLDVGPESLVGVCLGRSVELVVALLATWKVGGAYVPLDPDYPRERLGWILEDAQAVVLLTREELARSLGLRDTGVQVVCLDGAEEVAEDEPEVSLARVEPSTLAYVIYTSGSTGRPKGVAIEHRSAVALLCWARQVFSVEELAGVFAVTSISFDLSVFELFVPLACGGKVVLGEDALALADLPEAGEVRLVNTVPSAMAELVRLGAVPPSVRVVNLAGEPLRGELVDRLYALPQVERVLNLYGPSEDTTYSTYVEVPRGGGEPTIGRPIAGTQAYVLDPWLEPVPVGVAGELCLAGEGLARGYLGRPDLTAEKFVPDPFGVPGGGRLYRTGDLARYRADGEIEYLGRLDHQVKVRGFRIELGEIETALLRQAGVGEAVVVARDERGEKRLVAYVAPAGSSALPVPELRAGLSRELPGYMVPSAWVVLAALPRTPNGKVDRRALPAPEEGRRESGAAAPRSPFEEILALMWAQVLGLERVGVHDSFFEQGGHSLLATRVISRVREAFGVELRVRDLFEAPTVAGLADRIRQAMESTARSLLPPIEPVRRDADLPLSFAQERLWFLDQLAPGGSAYNMPVALCVRGPLDVAVMQAALGDVVRRHEALRTTFARVAGRPVQVIAAPAPVPLDRVDLTALPEPQRRPQALRLLQEEGRRRFDLLQGPLLRCLLVRIGEREHLLLLNMHHIVSDGWSMGVLVREICALYPALRRGGSSLLPELPIQYVDFAYWQRQWLRGAVLEAELSYWREQLAGVPSVLELPTDRPRPVVQTFSGKSLVFTLPRELSEQLQAVSRRLGATLFMTLLSVFQELLGRSSGQSDLTVGTPVAGRTHLSTEELIGFFVNVLVVRTDLSGEPSLAMLVGRVRETLLSAYAHQDLPFESLVEELHPERSLSHTPLFQVVFALQNTPVQALELEDLSFEPVAVETGTAKFDLTVLVRETETGLVGAAEYNTDLFDGATVQRLVGHWEVLLAGVVSAPERRLSELEWVTLEERAQLLLEWNDTTKRGNPRPLVHELFARHAALLPEATAVASPEGRLSYGEVERRANLLAWHLRGLGVAPEVLVAICMERTLLRVVGIVAVLKAGGAYVSLDPAYPEERMAFLLEDSGAPVLLTEARFASRLPRSSGARVLSLDVDWESIRGEESVPPGSGVGPEHLAYMVYTSGSTGRPKGVEVPHAGLTNLVRWHQELYQVVPEDRGTQIASPAFDASIWELWPYLTAGASVHIPDEETRLSSSEMIQWWAQQGITLPFLMTPLAEGVLEEGRPADLELRVRALLIGGDRLHRGPDPDIGFRLMNHYGPAEYTVVSTVVEVPPQGEEAGIPTIGRAIDNTRIYILDPWLRPVPVGVPGELCVAGVGLARGYHARPDLTAEKFVPDPFAEEPGARMYRTADRVRSLPDGNIDFLGRLDHQVKIRGLRIELGEVETVLSRHVGLREAAVVVREERPGDKRLVAYVVASEERGPGAEELRSFLSERLPEYMVPAAFVALESLPLTPNGKVDRRALPVPEWSTAVSFIAPRTPVEEVLVGILADVLGLERVGVEDDFFALGGHSLLATRLVSRLREVFGLELPLRLIFESPTVAQMAERIASLHDGRPAPPIRPVPRDRDLPLSFAQQRLWLIDQIEPDSPTYNIPLALRLTGGIEPRLLARIFSEIVRRHEALRTTFASHEGRPVQVVAAPEPLELPLIDLSCLCESEREARAHDLAISEARRPFDLRRGPLLRLLLVRLGETDHLLLLTMHHIVSDGWSMGVLMREVTALHEAYVQSLSSPLAELPVQYADFAVWQRSWLRGEALDAQLRYWRQRLAGAPAVLELPLDRQRPALQTFRGARCPVALSSALSEAVGRLCRQQGVTPFMTLLAGWAILLGRHTGQDDILVGVPIAGRNRREIENLIGFFVNTLVLRSELSRSHSLAGLLGEVRRTALDAFTHQDLPFERLVEDLAPKRSLAHTPLFQVMLILQNAPMGTLAVPGLSFSPVDVDAGLAKFDLSLTLAESPEGFAGTLTYAADLFDRSTVERLIAGFQTLLAGMAVADPGGPLLGLEVLSEAERQQLLVDWSVEDERVSAFSLHGLVERQAERTPDAVAVIFEEERWTYRDLLRRSREVAASLRAQGVGPGDRVAILDRRSAERVARVLGVLACGAACVAIDATQPQAWRARILEDVAPVRVLPPEPPLQVEGEEIVAGVSLLAEPDAPDAPAGSGRSSHIGPREADGSAYIVYTSGSTGRPKGILAHHRGAATYLEWVVRNYGLSESDVALQLAPLTFDASLRDTLAPLAAGGRIVIVPDSVARDPAALLERMEAQGVTCLPSIVPSLLRLLVEEARASGRTVPTLRLILASGEKMYGADAAAVRKAFGESVRLVNQYGASETTMTSTWYPVAADDESLPALPVGRPAASARMYLLNRMLRPVPLGAAGEICFGGPGLTFGYLGQPDRTAESFVPDPFGAPGERLYRTGDRGRYRSDGVLELLGRIDLQVKIRGQRVEPGEVEAVLRSHPAIREAVVAARGEDDPRLAAWLVAEEVGADELRAFLAERLPAPLVPTEWAFLDALPLTPHGKVDRESLPEPRLERTAVQTPRDRTELRLVRLWEEVLGVQPVGISDNFFDLGGHSLSAVRLMADVRRFFRRDFSFAELFRRPTIEALADLLRRGDRDLPWSPLVLLTAGPADEVPLFCIHGGDGHALTFADLARTLSAAGEERPVFALEARGLTEGQLPLESIEDMAELYLAAIREVRPQGPYRLLGYSMGSKIAFEIARRLERDGEAIEQLVLMDVPALPRTGSMPDLDIPEEIRALPEFDPQMADRFLAVWRANLSASHHWFPGPFGGKALLFVAEEGACVGTADPTVGWGAVTAGGIEVVTTPGDHLTLLQAPHVQTLVERMRAIEPRASEAHFRRNRAEGSALVAV